MPRRRQDSRERTDAFWKMVSFWPSRTILTAVELDVFNALGREAKTVEEVAREVNASQRGTELLLNALVGLGVLAKRGHRFVNTPLSREVLLADSPRNIGPMLRHFGRLWQSWSGLTDAVKTGKPTRGLVFRGAEKETEEFTLAMHSNALQGAPVVAEGIDLGGCRSLLDVGGGPGTYSVCFCQHNPKLSCTVLDLPDTLKVTRRIVAEFGLARRISLHPCDYIKDEMPGGYDAAWLSQVVHSEITANNLRLVRKVYRALNPGGRILVQDFVLDEGKTSPPSAALFALNMLVNTPGGRTYTAREIAAWLKTAGFKNVRKLDLVLPRDARIITGLTPR